MENFFRPVGAQLDAATLSHRECKVEIDRAKCKHFIYPLSDNLRSYQLKIVQNALLHNTLVVLPTGESRHFCGVAIFLSLSRLHNPGPISVCCDRSG
jgi:hypothetical protein